MNRRQFIILAQVLGLSVWMGEMAFTQAATIRTRRSATTSASAKDLDILRRGIGMMADNPTATQYESWMYWANSHGTPETIPPQMANVWSQCHHGTPFFLTWHRAYLLFFESVIRELTQEDDFALPYWDWYGSPEIPDAYREAPGENNGNSLFHVPREFRLRTLLSDALRQNSFEGFQSSLEGNPHGTVHVMVGGEMRAISTSARDPIFWAHHTNVDRMWEVWLALDEARENPTDETWLKRDFAFDVEGNKLLVVRDMLNTEELGYNYDSVAMTGPTDPTPPRPVNNLTVKAAPPIDPMSITPQTLATQDKIMLTGESINMQLLVPAASRQTMTTMAAPSSEKPQNLSVVLEGVKATELGLKRGFEYRVYVNLPKQKNDENQHQDFYIGVINSFLMGHHSGDGESIVYQISPLIEGQVKGAAWSTSDVNLSLISDDDEEKRPLVEIENIKLILSSEPLK